MFARKSALIFCLIITVNVYVSSAIAGRSMVTDQEILVFMNTELSTLPPYCKCKKAEQLIRIRLIKEGIAADRRSIVWPEKFQRTMEKWERIIDKSNWKHFHHYCDGIQRFNEALQMKADQKKDKIIKLNIALREFQYIIKCDGDKRLFPLWEELYSYRAQIYSMLGQPAKAYAEQKKANYFRMKKQKKSNRK